MRSAPGPHPKTLYKCSPNPLCMFSITSNAMHSFAGSYSALQRYQLPLQKCPAGILIGAHRIKLEKQYSKCIPVSSRSPYFSGIIRSDTKEEKAFCISPSRSSADTPTCRAGSEASVTCPCLCL